MGQPKAIGIDHTVAAGDWLKSPWSRKSALMHRASIGAPAPTVYGGPTATGAIKKKKGPELLLSKSVAFLANRASQPARLLIHFEDRPAGARGAALTTPSLGAG